MLEKIKASAGSGKTYTLTRRFLSLLAEMSAGQQDRACGDACRKSLPENSRARIFSEILAMTFTNKAAAEMKIRVIEALKKIVLDAQKADGGKYSGKSGRPDKNRKDGQYSLFAEQPAFSAKEAQAWLEAILRRYDSLNIRTIDSLLALLVRISAVGLDIPPDFEISFDDSAYLDPLYDELQDQAASDPQVAALLEDCAGYLIRHTRFLGLTPKDKIRRQILDVLTKIQEGAPLPCVDEAYLRSRLAEASHQLILHAELLNSRLEVRRLKPLENFRKFLEKCLNHQPGQESPINSAYARKASFSECVSKRDVGQVDAELEDAYASMRVALHDQGLKMQIYNGALALLPFARAAALLMPGLTALRSSSGTITGSMLPNLAKEVLDSEFGVSEACCRMGSRLSHLLIDEFQDTSAAQWQAIEPLAVECLSRGGSLRYVGDIKQAIYSWRGGDSSLFDKVAELPELLAMEPNPVFTSLGFNWRSAPNIVRHNNEFFSRLELPDYSWNTARLLLPNNYPEEEVGKAAAMMRQAFSGAGQAVPLERAAGPQGFVSIRKVPPTEAAEFYAEIRERFIELFREELLGRRQAGEIAVLVRTGDEAALAAEWLMELGLSLVTEHSFRLALNPLVQRLLSFLRFIDFPGDDLSFWNFVSGPECFGVSSGLGVRTSEAQVPAVQLLEDWLAGVRLEQSADRRLAGQPLFTYFRRDFPEAWQTLLEPFYNQAGFMSAYDLISELYERYSLFERQPGQAAYLRRFLEVLHLAEKQGHASPAAFLDFWADRGVEEKISMPETPDAVRIMTLHKSKGLEFPVVVMPFHRFTDSSTSELCILEFEGRPWLTRESPATGAEYYRKKHTAALEKLHLLYVGWTRASEELHLVVGGTEYDLSNAGMPRVLEYLLRDLPFDENGLHESGQRPTLVTSAEPEALAATATTPASHPPPVSPDPPVPHILPIPEDEDWRPMQWLPRLKIFRSPVPEVVYDERARGILFHNCLENLYLAGEAAAGTDIDERAVNNAVEYTLRNFTLPLNSLKQARQEASGTLHWFCSQPETRRWLELGRREQSIMDAEGRLRRMDLLVRDGDELLVVEYKSGRPQPEHREQIRNYLSLLAPGACNSADAHSLRGVLVYLDEQRLESVPLYPETDPSPENDSAGGAA